MVKSLDSLLNAYADHPIVGRLNEHITSEKSRILLRGTAGAQDSFILSGLEAQKILVIARDKEEAAYLYNDLDNICTKTPVYFVPDSFKRPLAFERMDLSNTLQRTEVINKISVFDRPFILVTYPESIFEKFVSPSLINEQRIKLVKHEKVDFDFLIEILAQYGFDRVDFVYEPGQFSVRGAIFDIFSYGNEWPYRVELFDDEVESIRLFDPLNQLSIKEINAISIVPDVNKKFSKSEKTSLMKIMPDDVLICFKDAEFTMDQLQFSLDTFNEFEVQNRALIEDENLSAFIEERAFVTNDQFLKEVEGHKLLFFKKPHGTIDQLVELNCQASPQPEFNKNFSLLIDDLRMNQDKGYANVLFTDSPRQIERFYAIFKDLEANVKFTPIPKSIRQGFIDDHLKIACYTDHQIFQRFHRYRLKKGFSKTKALNLRMLRELKPGDFVTHIDHGVGKYSGLEKITVNGRSQESVRLLYKNNDILYVSINSLHKISKFVGKDGTAPKLNKLGSDTWNRLKSKTKKKVKDIAQELIKLYAKRKASEGFAFPPDGYLQNELEASFMFEDTPDQLTTTEDVKKDMVASNPMDRLICGDVGFGKTEIAVRAVFKCVVGGKQAAVLVPTTILALQHYKTFSDRLNEFGVTVDYINRFKSGKQKRMVLEKLESGEIDVVIGTHSLLNKKVKFKDLGLLVVDEEQKFGVSAKEKLRNIKVNVDTLTLTATPIPRTLQFSLMAARDMSILRTPPPNRQPIHTEVRTFHDELIRDAIYYEINRGGQVYFVHNRVKSLPQIHALLGKLCPDVDIVEAHGQMDPKILEETLVDFIERKHDVLLCTNIIETGLDIPNVNTIIVNNAHQFGMSDLHQLRGRVGRSNKKAYCYLFCPPLSTLTTDARKRLRTLEEFSDLGSGFNIAMRDLDIRGAGNLLGAEQSGFIADIGYETYQKILEEAIQELKEREFKDLFKEELEEKRKFVRDVNIDTDVEMLIPDEYVSSIQERLSLYTELDNIESEEGISKFREGLEDRFGTIPDIALGLFTALRIRWVCKKLGFERLIYKNNKMRCYFVSNAQSPYYETDLFQRLLGFVASEGAQEGFHLKQSKKFLIMSRENVHTLEEVLSILQEIDERVSESVAQAGSV